MPFTQISETEFNCRDWSGSEDELFPTKCIRFPCCQILHSGMEGSLRWITGLVTEVLSACTCHSVGCSEVAIFHLHRQRRSAHVRHAFAMRLPS